MALPVFEMARGKYASESEQKRNGIRTRQYSFLLQNPLAEHVSSANEDSTKGQ